LVSGCTTASFTRQVATQDIVARPSEVGNYFDGELRFAGFCGYPIGMASEAMQDFPDTELLGRVLVGANLTFILPGNPADISFGYTTRYGIQLRLENYSMKLVEDYNWLALFDINAITASFQVLQLPNKGRTVGFHGDIGLGWSFISASRGRNLKQMDEFFGDYTDISADDTFTISFGGGIDFYLSREVFLAFDCRYVYMSVWTDWTVNGVPIFGIDVMNADTIQTCLSIGVRF
jgi:hypothetical protein